MIMADCHSDISDDVLQEYLLEDVEVSGRELGVGSYSSVVELIYKGMKCAGKKIHKTLYEQGAAVGPEILERFGTECELLSQLRHPHIVQFLGLHFEDGCDVPILVLEYMAAALTDCIEHYGIFPKEISYSILHDVAMGLNYLHDRPQAIIHRDLTANNVLLTTGMRAKISDLGMAKILNLAPAQMTRRMTICPGTISYMPPEALTASPLYDTKLDSFSFGVLMIHIFCGEWPLALEYLQPDPKHPGQLFPLTELQRRDKYLERLGHTHPLQSLIRKCLRNIPADRPEVSEILHELTGIAARFPPTFPNRIEMLNRIKADSEEKNQLRGEIEQLRNLLHEKEHEVENVQFSFGVEMESLREQVERLERTCVLQETQMMELHTENHRLSSSLAQRQEELDLLNRRIDQMSLELKAANSTLQERSQEYTQRLKKLQNDCASKSRERESALHRLARRDLDSALRLSLSERSCDSLSHDFQEFFLTNADEIIDALKRSRDVNHFEAQRLVCSMVQQSYTHCKTRVLEEVRRELERVFTVGSPPEPSGRTEEALHDARVAFGLLVRAADLQKSLCYREVSGMVLKNLQQSKCLRRASSAAQTSLKTHVEHACKLAWGLVTTCPPMIVCQPTEFREDWHDREFEYWDKNVHHFRLLYTRPVLFWSHEGRVGVKGWVGNRDSSRLTPPRDGVRSQRKS